KSRSSYNFRIVRKIVICGSSHILRINLQSSDSNLFQKNESWILTTLLTLIKSLSFYQRANVCTDLIQRPEKLM
ncbi:hypothetical protein, partial [Leptospira alexanderi]|uniref:hypothetical protein n=1 Tax=Leptospira alexanderi TaxID=100053 RepID=UPI000990F222